MNAGTISFDLGPQRISVSPGSSRPVSEELAFGTCELPRHTFEFSNGKYALKSEKSDCKGSSERLISSSILPGLKFSRLIAVLTALNSSGLWHEDAREILSADFKPEEIKRALEFAILGASGGLKFPSLVTVKWGQQRAKVKGLVSISRGRYMSNFSQGLNFSDEARERVKTQFEANCKAGSPGALTSSQCAVYAQQKSYPAFSNFLYSGWKEEGSESQLGKFSGQLDSGGKSILMGLAPLACGITENKVGGSGFSSGESLDRKRMKVLFPAAIKLETDINRVDRLGRTALFYAMGAGCQEETDLLIGAGARLDLVDYNGIPLLHYALLGKTEKQYPKLVSLTPNSYLEKSSGITWIGTEYRQENTEQMFNRLQPVSSLTLAVSEGQGSALGLLLAKKPKLNPEAEGQLLRLIVSKKNASVVEAAVKAGLKFTVARDQSGVFFPAKSILSEINGFPEEDRGRLTSLLEPIAKSSEKDALKICESDPQGSSRCIISAGLCSLVGDIPGRDQCFMGRGECKEIQDPVRRGLCERSRFSIQNAPSGPRACKKEGMNEASFEACQLETGTGKEILDRVRRLLATRAGTEAFLSELRARPGLLRDKLETEEFVEFASECLRAPMVYAVQTWDGHRACQTTLELSSKLGAVNELFKKRLPKCEKEGSSQECLAPAIYLMREASDSKATAAILNRLCREKDAVACMVGLNQKIIPMENAREASIASCEGLLTLTACSPFHMSVMSMGGMNAMSRPDMDAIKRLALKGEQRSIDFVFNGFSRINVTQEETNQLLGLLTARCKDELASCSTLSRVLQREGRQSERANLAKEVFGRLEEECGKRRNCQIFKELAMAEGDKKKLNDLCAGGNASACGGFVGAIENPNEPKVTLAGTLECLKKNADKNGCALLISRLAANFRKEGKALPDSICNISMGHECTSFMAEERLAELAFDSQRVKSLEKACNPESSPGACFWAAKHFAYYQPEKAQRLFKKICDASKYERAPACTSQLKLLKAKKSLKELASFKKEVCRNPNSSACSEASIGLIQVSPKVEGAKARSECLSGNNKQCDYYLGYLSQVDSAAANTLRSEVCAKHKTHCPPTGGNMMGGMMMPYMSY